MKKKTTKKAYWHRALFMWTTFLSIWASFPMSQSFMQQDQPSPVWVYTLVALLLGAFTLFLTLKSDPE